MDDGPSMTQETWLTILREGRRAGASGLWIGGGEPTMRPDLLKMIRIGRRLGYKRIKIQTNGALLSSSMNLDRLIAAGLNEVNLSVKGHTASMHDAFTSTAGSFALLEQALEHLSRMPVLVEADVLLYRDNVATLPDLVAWYVSKGVHRFNLWHLSMFGASDEQAKILAEHVPKMSDVAQALDATLADERSKDATVIRALHLPPCVLPRKHWDHLFRAQDLNLKVFDPGGSAFMLQDSPFEGGVFLERCQGCSARSICDGLRQDYLALYSDEEFQPCTEPAQLEDVTMKPF